ncbi:MAG: SpoIIE family protein phosphatase [Magnetococcales bacterium]|nr:SpoIIE family protein phosphatase [Magnetococcales bacterium]
MTLSVHGAPQDGPELSLAQPDTSQETPKPHATILACDDDEVLLGLISQFLSNKGFRVIEAESGAEALAIYRKQPPDLVLLDAKMPGMDGFEVCQQMRSQEIPILMVTALDDAASVKQAYEAGAEEYLAKPIHWHVLEHRIHAILKRKKAEADARWAHLSQQLISALLQGEDPALSLAQQLEKSLEKILKISWLKLENRGAVFLLEPSKGVLQLVAQQGMDPFYQTACARVPVGHCLCGRAVAERWVVFADHVDERHEIRMQEMADHGHYCVPIGSGPTILGVLNLSIKAGLPRDLPMQATLLTIGSTLANIIERKRMAEEIKIHRDSLAFEREFIEDIITRMRASKRFDPRQMRLLQAPVEKTMGDLLLADFRPDGAQHVMLGDFTGHGLPAAIGGPIVSDIFYSMTAKGSSLEEIMDEINCRLYEKTPAGMFLAAGFMEVDPLRKQLTVWNCSIPDMLVFRGGQIRQRIPSKHFARGLVDRPDEPGLLVEVEAGDRVIAFSDGFIEEVDGEGQMFGQDRFEALLVQMLEQQAPLEMLQEIHQGFRAGRQQSDDMTLVELTC